MLRLDTRWNLAIGVMVLMMALDAPAQDKIQVFFGNSHSHTALSDGCGTPAKAYDHARDVAGLDYLAITEHDFGRAVCPTLRRRSPTNTRSTDYEINRLTSFEA